MSVSKFLSCSRRRSTTLPLSKTIGALTSQYVLSVITPHPPRGTLNKTNVVKQFDFMFDASLYSGSLSCGLSLTALQVLYCPSHSFVPPPKKAQHKGECYKPVELVA